MAKAKAVSHDEMSVAKLRIPHVRTANICEFLHFVFPLHDYHLVSHQLRQDPMGTCI